MAQPLAPISSRQVSPITMERLQVLLDAYGANPDRWPSAERDGALALLAASAEARSLQIVAAELDGALDLVPEPQPSAQLFARALAQAPRRRTLTVRRWLAAASLPLAAAAVLALWLRMPESEPTAEPAQYAVQYLGAYVTPTDLLLEPPGFDLSDSAPTVGCTAGGLGCPDLEVPSERQSQVLHAGAIHA